MEKIEDLLTEVADNVAILCVRMRDLAEKAASISDYFEWEKEQSERDKESNEMRLQYEHEMKNKQVWIGMDEDEDEY